MCGINIQSLNRWAINKIVDSTVIAQAIKNLYYK